MIRVLEMPDSETQSRIRRGNTENAVQGVSYVLGRTRRSVNTNTLRDQSRTWSL
jgi:hypothetical protein